jgi:hypothetical protein
MYCPESNEGYAHEYNDMSTVHIITNNRVGKNIST